MSHNNLSSTVNKHYLNKVMELAEVMDVVATEDIFDVRGMKLLAKGAKVSRGMQEKLILHKLQKPIESSIQVDDGVDAKRLLGTAEKLLTSNQPLMRIMQANPGIGPSPLAMLSKMHFGNAMSIMLTITDRGSAHALEHCMMVSLLAMCMAKKLRLSAQEQMVAGLAGVLHDIGELYIDPVYLQRGKRLLPHEWSHLVVHPRIGQLLIDQLESYPTAVGRAVAEHHERLDGTGYPKQTVGGAISAPGQALSVAEMIAGILLSPDRPLERAELALKIMPSEHAYELLSAISGGKRLQASSVAPQHAAAEVSVCVESLFLRISNALEMGEALVAGPSAKSLKTCELLQHTLQRIRAIQRAFISTGLDIYLSQKDGFSDAGDHAIHFEKAVATREIQWRLRDIARDLALHSSAPDEKRIVAPLIELLDVDSASDAIILPTDVHVAPVNILPLAALHSQQSHQHGYGMEQNM